MPGARFHNLYVPTETNVCTHEALAPGWSAGDGLTIGRATDGDIGRFEADGRLRLSGRRDHQVKRGGHRIDLLDIENTARELSDVDNAAAVVSRGEIWLYVVTSAPERISSALAGALPRRMLPDRVVPVDALPLNQRGKVDRLVLSERSA